MKILAFLFVTFLTSQLLLGQNSNVSFYNIGVDDGLSHNMVNNITEDTLGFMWFATQDGLNRYDGYNFKVYYAGDNNRSVAYSFITELKVDSHNQLWICYVRGGVSRFDPISETFHHYNVDDTKPGNLSSAITSNTINNINSAFFEDSKNNIWIATDNGVNRYVRETDNFEVLQHNSLDTNSISDNRITYITEDREGFIWIGTESGLNIYDPNTEDIVRCRLNINKHILLSDTKISIIKARSDGSIWVGTKQKGLIIIEHPNSNNQKITQLLNKIDIPLRDASVFNMYETKLGDMYIGSRNGMYYVIKNDNGYYVKLIIKGKGDEYIYHFTEDNKGDVWVASNLDESLMTINTHDQTTKQITSLNNDESEYEGERIISFYLSRSGLLWIGSIRAGVYRVNLNTKAFNIIDDNPNKGIHLSNKEIYAIYEDDKRNLYVAVKNALNILNLDNNTTKVIRGERDLVNDVTYRYSNGLPGCLISSIKENPDGKIWLTEYDNKISLYNPTKNNFINFHNNENDNNSFKIWSPRTICVTQTGDTYFGGPSDGLCKLNTDGLSFSYSPIVEIGDSTGTNDKWINIIDEDSSGLLWIGTLTGGLNMFNPKTNAFTHYTHDPTDSVSISGNTVNSIFSSSKFNNNIVWVGTVVGLNKFNKNTREFKSYTVEDGMPSNTIYGILEDDKGMLWLSTTNGLVRFDPITEEITVFSKEDGLQGDVFDGNSYFKNRDGVMYFGGTNGLTYFNPKEIKSNAFNSNITFTNFKLFNKIVKVNDTINNNVVLHKSISYSKEISLNYNNKIISFEFASLQFVNNKKTRYRYKLDGFETDWNEVDYRQRFANYTNLPSGYYTLKLEGTNSDGKWSNYTEMSIRIIPPFWETLWFRLMVISFILMIIIIVIKYRTKRLQTAKDQLEKLVFKKTKDLSEVNASLEETQEELSYQNTELLEYKNHLENMVTIRTSALKEAKIRAEESDRLKSAFLANISHEIRTPLNAIMGFSLLFIEEDISKKEIEEYVNIIQNSSNSLLTIISDIIDISSIQVGQLEIVKSVFSVDKTLKELKKFYDLKNDIGIGVQFIPDKNHETVHINNDAKRFKQIMTNLINNSIKFTQKGFVRFGYDIIDSEIRFFVHDNGPGIALEAQKNIFQYFNKVNAEKGKFHEGTGLGLSISKHLVEQMGGKIWFESEINVGTKFFFELPLN